MSDVPRQRNIRTTYYIVFLLILVSQFLTFSLIYFSSLKKDYNLISSQLYESIMDQKRNQLEVVVNEKIVEINELENFLRSQLIKGAETQCRLISRFIQAEGFTSFQKDQPRWFSSDEWNYRITDLQTGEVYTDAPDERDSQVDQDLDPAGFNTTVPQKFDIYVSASPRFFYNTFLAGVHALVYATNLPQDGYVWIDWIRNYQGGDDYAVRLVHPNLPETEGSYLSTNTTDIKGNRPYLRELEGVREDGEVTHEYYFKKMNSDEIIRKLSYARLIRKFDWVIATGVNLDDVDANFARNKEDLARSFRQKKDLFIGTITIVIILSLIMITLFEKRVSIIINTYIRESAREQKKLAEAYDRMKTMAYVDNLTDLLNRRAMFEILEKEISRFKRGNPGFCIILSDIDKFKTINDTYGHNTGDFILKETARILRNCIRLEDQISRWGGEEFLFFIPDSSRTEGLLIAEKLRRTMEEHLFQENGITHHVTMTFGVTSSREDLDLKSLIHEADQNLYKGKRSTRNCVVG